MNDPKYGYPYPPPGAPGRYFFFFPSRLIVSNIFVNFSGIYKYEKTPIILFMVTNCELYAGSYGPQVVMAPPQYYHAAQPPPPPPKKDSSFLEGLCVLTSSSFFHKIYIIFLII